MTKMDHIQTMIVLASGFADVERGKTVWVRLNDGKTDVRNRVGRPKKADKIGQDDPLLAVHRAWLPKAHEPLKNPKPTSTMELGGEGENGPV